MNYDYRGRKGCYVTDKSWILIWCSTIVLFVMINSKIAVL
jgi:hypothetical protein